MADKDVDERLRRVEAGQKSSSNSFLLVGIVIGLLVGGAVIWYLAPNGPNSGPKTVPDACVLAIRDDFAQFFEAASEHPLQLSGAAGAVQAAFAKYEDDAFACQKEFPDEPPLNRLGAGSTG